MVATRHLLEGMSFTVTHEDFEAGKRARLLAEEAAKKGDKKALLSRYCPVAQALDRQGFFHLGCWSLGVQVTNVDEGFFALHGAREFVRHFDRRQYADAAALLPLDVLIGARTLDSTPWSHPGLEPEMPPEG